jgi:hypothetical protein
MSGIITDEFRKANTQSLVDAINNDLDYYIGIGKSDYWDQDSQSAPAPTPVATIGQANDVLSNLISISQVEADNAYRLIPRVNWSSGDTYKQYSAEDQNCFFAEGSLKPCYVMTSNRDIFVCLRNALDDDALNSQGVSSTEEPSITGTANAKFDPSGASGLTVESDGYVWAYVCTIKKTTGYYTNQFIAISNAGGTHVTNDTYLTASSTDNAPSNATPGLLYGFEVVSNGSGYTTESSIDLKVTGNRWNGSAWESFEYLVNNDSSTDDVDFHFDGSNGINLIRLRDEYFNNTSRHFNQIANATVEVNGGGGSGAKVKALIGPMEGFGGDTLKLLPSYYVGIRADFENTMGSGSEQDAFYIPFRQVSLIKDVSGANTSAEAVPHIQGTLNISTPSSTTQYTGYYVWKGSAASAKAALAAGEPVAIVDTITTDGKLYYHPSYDFDSQSGDDPVSNFRIADFTNTSPEDYKISQTFVGAASQVFTTAAATENDPEYLREVSFTAAGYQGHRQNGDVLFVENREFVSRAEDQTEEVRLVIQM